MFKHQIKILASFGLVLFSSASTAKTLDCTITLAGEQNQQAPEVRMVCGNFELGGRCFSSMSNPAAGEDSTLDFVYDASTEGIAFTWGKNGLESRATLTAGKSSTHEWPRETDNFTVLCNLK